MLRIRTPIALHTTYYPTESLGCFPTSPRAAAESQAPWPDSVRCSENVYTLSHKDLIHFLFYSAVLCSVKELNRCSLPAGDSCASMMNESIHCGSLSLLDDILSRCKLD